VKGLGWWRGLEDYLGEAAELASLYYELCGRCHLCSYSCVSFRATGDPSLSPFYRLESAYRVLVEGRVEDRYVFSLYTCSLCAACTITCPYAIEVWRVVHAARLKLSLRGRQPRSLEQVAVNLARGGHSFTPSGEEPRRLLLHVARKLGLRVDEPADVLYVPSPFETTLYPEVLEASLELIARSGRSVTLSPMALDFGGNAAIDAARPDVGVEQAERVVDKAGELGAEIVLSGCGSDHKLASLLGLKARSIYDYSGCENCPLRNGVVFPSCGFSRFDKAGFERLRRLGARFTRDRPPVTLCCGGGGGVNYLQEDVFRGVKRRVYSWRARMLAREGGGVVSVPCIKCYTVLRQGALLARLAGRLRVEHLTRTLLYVQRRRLRSSGG